MGGGGGGESCRSLAGAQDHHHHHRPGDRIRDESDPGGQRSRLGAAIIAIKTPKRTMSHFFLLLFCSPNPPSPPTHTRTQPRGRCGRGAGIFRRLGWVGWRDLCGETPHPGS